MPSVKAGRFTYRVRIEKDYASPESTPDWRPITNGIVWAEILAVSGGERAKGQMIEAGVTSLITIRYRSDVTTQMRIVPEQFPLRKMNIVRSTDPDGSQVILSIQCQEVP